MSIRASFNAAQSFKEQFVGWLMAMDRTLDSQLQDWKKIDILTSIVTKSDFMSN